MKNILSLDGGGTRGVFSVQILKRIEELLREKYDRKHLVLADHFHYIGGTSTGAIIAALLSWGAPMDVVEEFYLEQSKRVFGHKTGWTKFFRYKFHAEELVRLLREYFSEGADVALLGTKKLRTLYLCVMRNATTGAPWIITNSPGAKYNKGDHPENNLNIPLYQLIRASTAAPVFFEPEEIASGRGQNWMFIDGAITPYNNPAFLMYLTATQPAFGNNWKDGADQMRVISVGTGRKRVKFTKLRASQINTFDQVKHALLAMIDSNNQNQDWMCRTFGHCLWGEAIDSEVGDLISREEQIASMKEMGDVAPVGDLLQRQISSPSQKKFLYCRYNHNLTQAEIDSVRHIPDFYDVDSLKGIPFWRDLGTKFAEKAVQMAHLV